MKEKELLPNKENEGNRHPSHGASLIAQSMHMIGFTLALLALLAQLQALLAGACPQFAVL